MRWCLEQAPSPGLIVDLGCGTGISTRLFASTGHPVIGIDPNADMLATARAEGAQDYRVGTSEQSGLPDACADRSSPRGPSIGSTRVHLRRSGAHRHPALRVRGLLERAPGGPRPSPKAMRPCCARGPHITSERARRPDDQRHP
ncbi:MAG: class I SAM-dependent methyltransferase [Flavobacteriales bacterium]|nr:class I SAM-dependent methyltransferase [Flavobacteriales bacterium]